MDARYFISLISKGLFSGTHIVVLKWKVPNGHLGSTSWSLTAYYLGIYEYMILFEHSL